MVTQIYSRQGTIDGVLQANLIAAALDLLLQDQEQITSAGLHDYDFENLFGVLEAHVEELGTDRVASLEWAYLGAFSAL